MSKPKTLSEELKDVKKTKRQEAISNNSVVQAVKGLWLFAEGSALIVTAVYAIYQGWNSTMPAWGSDVLMVSGVLVLVPAGILLGRFFRNVGKG